jgi:hypothetical protein
MESAVPTTQMPRAMQSVVRRPIRGRSGCMIAMYLQTEHSQLGVTDTTCSNLLLYHVTTLSFVCINYTQPTDRIMNWNDVEGSGRGITGSTEKNHDQSQSSILYLTTLYDNIHSIQLQILKSCYVVQCSRK